MSNTTTKSFSTVKLNTQFTMASTKANITSGENLMVSLGKIAKWYDATNGFASSSVTIPSITISNDSTTGNAITNISSSNHTLTLSKGSFLPSTTTYAASDTVGGDALKAKALSVNYRLGTGYSSTATFSTAVNHNSSLSADYYAIGFLDNDENATITNFILGLDYSNNSPHIFCQIIDKNGNSYGASLLTAHPTITTSTDTTSTVSPVHGGTFTAIDSVTRDTNGHVTKVNTKTVTLPAQYTHPSGFTAKTTAGFYKYTVDANGHVTAGAALAKSDITALGISASDHTHSYIPLSGSSSITGSLIPSVTDSYNLGSSAKRWYDCYFKMVNTQSLYDVNGTIGGTITVHANLNPASGEVNNLGNSGSANAWNLVYAKYYVAYESMKHYVPSSGSWSRGIAYCNYDGSSTLGMFGAYGSASTLSYYFIGNSYSDTDHLMRIDNDGTGKMTLVGTLPQLKFRQTTSGAAYNDNNAGIKCYSSNTNGMNMTIQSGGTIIIGSGEYPINFYNAMINGNNTTSDNWGNEQMYIGSDNQVYVHTNANTIGNRHTFAFGSTGSFAIAPGGDLVIKRGTEASPVSHVLTTAATTTARTWTLPNATGTLVSTADAVNITSGLTSSTGGTMTYNIYKNSALHFAHGTISLTLKSAVSANTATLVTTLPSGCRPVTVNAACPVYTNVAGTSAYGYVWTSGTVYFISTSSIASGKIVYISFAFPI